MLMFRSFHTCIFHIDKKIFNFELVVPKYRLMDIDLPLI